MATKKKQNLIIDSEQPNDKNLVDVVLNEYQIPETTFNVDDPPIFIKEEISKDLNIPLGMVNSYFDYRQLFFNRPIRNLTFAETVFATQLKNLSTASNQEIIELLTRVGVNATDYRQDTFLLPKKLAKITDENQYQSLIKWRAYLLDPYIQYGLPTAPLLRPLKSSELVVIADNGVMGISLIPGQEIQTKDQINFIRYAIDIRINLLSKNENAQIEENKKDKQYEEFTIDELKKGISLLKNSQVESARGVNIKENADIPIPVRTKKPKIKKETKKDDSQ